MVHPDEMGERMRDEMEREREEALTGLDGEIRIWKSSGLDKSCLSCGRDYVEKDLAHACVECSCARGFREGMLVRVIKQPRDVLADILYEVGFIESLHPNKHLFIGTEYEKLSDKRGYALVTTLRKDGDAGGCGSIQLDHLAIETDSEWLKAKQLREARLYELEKSLIKRTDSWNERIQQLAERHKITVEEVTAIYNELRNFCE